jgi:hypothetical protein
MVCGATSNKSANCRFESTLRWYASGLLWFMAIIQFPCFPVAFTSTKTACFMAGFKLGQAAITALKSSSAIAESGAVFGSIFSAFSALGLVAWVSAAKIAGFGVLGNALRKHRPLAPNPPKSRVLMQRQKNLAFYLALLTRKPTPG